jgi:hypothetical protein
MGKGEVRVQQYIGLLPSVSLQKLAPSRRWQNKMADLECPVRRLRFTLPPAHTPLRKLRQEIADYTHLPADSFKLVHAGAVMKDDNTPSASDVRSLSGLL